MTMHPCSTWVIACALQVAVLILSSVACFGYYVAFATSSTDRSTSAGLWGDGVYPPTIKAVKACVMCGFIASAFAAGCAATIFVKAYTRRGAVGEALDSNDLPVIAEDNQATPVIQSLKLGRLALLLNLFISFSFFVSGLTWAIWAGNQQSANKFLRYYAVAGWIASIAAVFLAGFTATAWRRYVRDIDIFSLVKQRLTGAIEFSEIGGSGRRVYDRGRAYTY